MGFQFEELPAWEFTVTEESAGVYRVVAFRDVSVTGQNTGTDPDAQIDDLKR